LSVYKDENGKYSIVPISSKLFKKGCITVMIPSEYLEVGGSTTIRLPRTELLDSCKIGKIGTFQIKIPPNGKLNNIPILRTKGGDNKIWG